MRKIKDLIRPCILKMQPYSSARNEYKGEATVFLDANENPYNAPYNRYPDPLQWEVKQKIARLKGVKPEQIFLGNGSDEPIDLMIRVFCEPRKDNIVAIDPTYGMYQVAAEINDVEYKKVPLTDTFDLDAETLLQTCNENTKLIYLCSPNNPTGNSLSQKAIIEILSKFSGIVIIDEAYIDFSKQPSFLEKLENHPNLVVFQTFSKAWGSAGIRLGMAFASEEIITTLNKIKYPYNVNILTQKKALEMLDKSQTVQKWIETLLEERTQLVGKLKQIPYVQKIYPTDANFVLVKVPDANHLYHYLVNKGVVVRNRNTVTMCAGCLRITVGTPQENNILVDALKQYPGV